MKALGPALGKLLDADEYKRDAGSTEVRDKLERKKLGQREALALVRIATARWHRRCDPFSVTMEWMYCGLVVVALASLGCGRVSFDALGDASAGGGDATADATGDAPPMIVASCAGLSSTCGPQRDRSCCEISETPGGTFLRGYDVATDTLMKDMSRPATLSAFRLDTYEVTVGRFRTFVDAGMGTRAQPPMAGAGAHANLSGSGWDSAWNTALVVDRTALEGAIKCNGAFATWTDAPGANEDRPINCITFFEAMAFCAWDGGFLPTEAQSVYAATGGDEQRVFPWSTPPSSASIDCSVANFGGSNAPSTACVATGPHVVGSVSPQGDARWGHADLGGNVGEWLLDWRVTPMPLPCIDCANLMPNPEVRRSVRDGSFIDSDLDLRAHYRDVLPPDARHPMFGVRCARP